MKDVNNMPIEIGKLLKSKRNVRKAASSAHDDEQLKASIAAHGLLQNLIVVPAPKKSGFYEVIAGGRRIRLINELVKEKVLNVYDLMPCKLLSENATAEEISAAENIKSDMDPVDLALAFGEMSKSGRTVEELQVSFALTEREVKRSLRLSAIHPTILKSYQKGDIEYRTLEAFGISDNKKEQLSVFKGLKNNLYAYKVRELLEQEKVPGDDRRAIYVGRKDYIAAGGQVEEDLFSSEDDSTRFNDVQLLDKLFKEKLTAAAKRLESREGWNKVDVLTDQDYFITIPTGWKEHQPPKGQKKFTKAQASEGRAAVYVDYHGKLKTQRNMFPASAKAKKAAAKKGDTLVTPADIATDRSTYTKSLDHDLGIHLQQTLQITVHADRLESLYWYQTALAALGEYTNNYCAPDHGESQLAFRLCNDTIYRPGVDPQEKSSSAVALKKLVAGLDLSFMKPGYSAAGFELWDSLPESKQQPIRDLSLRVRMRVKLTDSEEPSTLVEVFADHGGEVLHEFWRPTYDNYFSRLNSGQLKAHLHEFYDGERDEFFSKLKKAELGKSCHQFIHTPSDVSGKQNDRSLAWLPDGFVTVSKK